VKQWHGEETGGEQRHRREEAAKVHVETQRKGRRRRRKLDCEIWARCEQRVSSGSSPWVAGPAARSVSARF